MYSKVSVSFKVVTMSLLLMGSSMVMAQSKSNQELTGEVANLQLGLSRIEQQMSQLQRLLDNRAMLELFQRMDELSDEVSNLRGQLEQQNHDLAGLKKRQRELYLDTDGRLRELEITSNRPANADISVTPSRAAPAVAGASTGGANIEPILAPIVATAPPASVNAGKPDEAVELSAKPMVTVSEERAAYQKAFDMLKEGRYKMANTAFKEFLQKYPQSSYAGNAQYWLGESNYVTRQFKEAVEEFETVLKEYPESNKVPDAMLKLGYTYYELQDFQTAKVSLLKLRETYPRSTAARLAGKRLDRMKKENH